MFTFQKETFDAGIFRTRMVTNFRIYKDGEYYAIVATEEDAKDAVDRLNRFGDDFQWSGYAD